MVTLRTYADPVAAGFAKSTLEANGIVCSLADEGANAWGGAPLAMPIRLLVNDEQADDARRILDDAANQPGEPLANAPEDMKTLLGEVRDELAKLHDSIKGHTILLIVLIAGMILYA